MIFNLTLVDSKAGTLLFTYYFADTRGTEQDEWEAALQATQPLWALSGDNVAKVQDRPVLVRRVKDITFLLAGDGVEHDELACE